MPELDHRLGEGDGKDSLILGHPYLNRHSPPPADVAIIPLDFDSPAQQVKYCNLFRIQF